MTGVPFSFQYFTLPVVNSLSIRSYRAFFLHWADLQAPRGTLAAIYITLKSYSPTPPRRV